MGNKQTPIQWLEKELIKRGVLRMGMIIPDEVFAEATQMDIEQKQNMFDCGRQFQLTGEGTFKEVYEEMYEGK
jgi:hypothetical protein